MDYVVNELSLHAQFHSIPEFEKAIERLVNIRNEILRLGSSLFCHRGLVNARVTHELVLQQAVQALPPARRGALMVWITRTGPHWEDAREHREDDWLEAEDQIVTDSAVGEASMCCRVGTARELVSFSPSGWLKPTIDVTWVREDASREVIRVQNHWELGTIQASLAANPASFDSWTSLDVGRS